MNDKKMILANIGSGSSYLPDIAQMLIDRREMMKVAEWRLMDIDEYRLNCTGKYVQKMFADAGMDTKVILTKDLDTAVADCDYVIVTIRPGRSEARILDETLPFKHGLIGQETTAPGGMIMGFKSILPMLKIAAAIERCAKKLVGWSILPIRLACWRKPLIDIRMSILPACAMAQRLSEMP